MAAFANMQCVRDRLREIAEHLPHFSRRFKIQFRQIPHSAFVLHHFAGADTKHHVVRLVIASAEKMHVIRRHEGNAQVSRNLHQRDVAHLLLFHSVIVQFHEEIFRAENIAIFHGALFCFLDVVRLNCAVDFPRKTAAQPDQTFRARGQHLLVDSRRVMKPIQMRCGHQLHEVAIASFIFGQQREVICRFPARRRPVLVRSRCDINLTAYDRFDPGALRLLVEFNRAKQIAVVSHRHGGHPKFRGFFHQLPHSDTSIQQRIFGVQMKVNERVPGHQA